MLSWGSKPRRRPLRLRAGSFGLAAWLAIGQLGSGAGPGDLWPEQSRLEVESPPSLRAPSNLPSPAVLLPRTNATPSDRQEPLRATNAGIIAPSSSQPILDSNFADPRSLGFAIMTNLQAEREQFEKAFEELRRHLEAGAARNAQTIATGLSVIEPVLNRRRTESMEALRRLSQTTLLSVAGLGVILLIGIFAAAFILARGMNRFAAVLTARRPPAGMPDTAATLPRSRAEPAPSKAGGNSQASSPTRLSPSYVSGLVGKGEALLHLGKPEQALQCFEEALAAEPDRADILVKRGLALSQLQRLEEALESYDRALCLDNSITVAYLHKGGVCNQLRRHGEALECYEKALDTRRGRGAAGSEQ